MIPELLRMVPGVEVARAQSVPSYETADARIAYRFAGHVELSANDQNLLQHHQEYSGDNSNAVYIRRDFYGELRWTW